MGQQFQKVYFHILFMQVFCSLDDKATIANKDFIDLYLNIDSVLTQKDMILVTSNANSRFCFEGKPNHLVHPLTCLSLLLEVQDCRRILSSDPIGRSISFFPMCIIVYMYACREDILERVTHNYNNSGCFQGVSLRLGGC